MSRTAAPIDRADWPRLLALVDQALEVPVERRESWLLELDLPERLSVALRGLLRDREALEADRFLAELPELAGSSRGPGRLAADAQVGPWRLIRELGQGGMSTVWLVERADGQVTRRAAMKLPHAGPGHEQLAARLQRERNILAALEHPHIARLYDVGVTDEGVPYLVMEYVEGTTLTAHADTHRMSISQRLRAFREVLAAVQFAHGKLVLHRDIKPANILVDAAGVAKLLDFGIAKLLAFSGETGAAATELTQAAGRRLTLAYASPEQIRGEPLGTASDVFSLGIVLYELLCAKHPFDVRGLSAGRAEVALLEREPRTLAREDISPQEASARGTTPAALRRALAGDLDAIVLKALSKAPERRYPSADALDADIARWLQGQPVLARPPSRWYHLVKFATRHRLPLGLGTLAVSALAVTTTVAFVQASLARQQAARASSVRDFLVALFNETDPNTPHGHDLTARTLLEEGRRRAGQTLPDAPELRAELLHYLGDAQANLSDYTGADATYAESVEAWRQAGDARAQAMALAARADNALSLGRPRDASAWLRQADALAKDFAHDSTLQGTLLRENGYTAGFFGKWEAERDSLQRFLALDDRRPGPALERARALENLATVHSRLGDLEAALARIDEAFHLLDRHPEIAAPARFDVVNYGQDIELQWGRYAQMERTSPERIRECDRQLSPRSSTCLKLKLRLFNAQLRLGRIDPARALGAELTPLLDPGSPRDQIVALASLARLDARAGTSIETAGHLATLRELSSAPPFKALTPKVQLIALDAIAEAELVAGRQAEAFASIERARALVASDGSSISPDETHRLEALHGIALEAQGEHAKALQAMASLCAGPAPGDPNALLMSFLSLNCVRPLVSEGRADEAVRMMQKAMAALRESLGEESPAMRSAGRWLDSLRATRSLPVEPVRVLSQFS